MGVIKPTEPAAWGAFFIAWDLRAAELDDAAASSREDLEEPKLTTDEALDNAAPPSEVPDVLQPYHHCIRTYGPARGLFKRALMATEQLFEYVEFRC